MTLIRFTLAAALLMASLTPLHAQTVHRVAITAPRADAHAQVLDQLAADNRYEMSDGRTMIVSFAGPDTVHLRYGRHLRRQLKADGPGRFVSSDGHVRLVFALDAQGWIDQVQLTVPADLA